MSTFFSSKFSLSSSSGQYSSSYDESVCYYNRQEQIEDIEDVEFSEMNEEDENGNSSLIFAVQQGREDAAVDMIDQGAFVDHQNINGETALFWASTEGHESLVNILLENGANPNVCRLDGASPLHLASANGHLNIISLLVKNGAFVNVQDEVLDTPLHYAVRECKMDVIDLLVKRYSAKLDMKNEDLESPLDLACCLVTSDQKTEYEYIVKALSSSNTDHSDIHYAQNRLIC